MDINWTILGFAGTIFFGILTAILGAKAIRKYKIEHFEINSYEIGKGLMKQFRNLSLSYNNNKIENNLTVIEGGFINTRESIKGDDIQFDMIFPEKCRILDVTTKVSNENLIVTPDMENNKLHYTIDKKIMHNEFFLYSVIVESDEELEDIISKISFEHRMCKTGKIDNLSGTLIKGIPTKQSLLMFSLFFLFFLLLGVASLKLLTHSFFDNSQTLILYILSGLIAWCMVGLCLCIYDYYRFKKLWSFIQRN